ncbi:MAG: DNA-binding response regulator, partial [Cytophagales bacterium]|nr:DNA-binding response regulator [Cytophagales bacterium]
MNPMYKVLIVDDEADIAELLQYNLTKEGYEVRVAPDG